MENADIKLDNLIRNLRSQKPRLNNQDLLTDSIMMQVAVRSYQSKPAFLIWIRAISSSAAVLLLGLFIFQQADVSEIKANSMHFCSVKSNISIDFECAQNMNGNKSNLIETYFCHMASNSIKNKRLQSFYQQ